MKLFNFLVCICFNLSLFSQSLISNPLALKIGDKVPNLKLGKVLANGNLIDPAKDSLSVADFKGKLLILDFWTSTCGYCINSFPEVEELQDKYRDKVAFVSIGFAWKSNTEKLTGDITDLIEEWKSAGKKIRIPVTRVVESRIFPQPHYLSSFFPFRSTPTIVWIDEDGIFRGITDHRSLKEVNIDKLLSGQSVQLRQIKPTTSLDISKPFLLNRSFDLSGSTIIGSAFSGFIDSLNEGMLGRNWEDSNHYYAVNASVFSLYMSAYGRLDSSNTWIHRKRIVVEPEGETFYKDRYLLKEELKRKDDWETDKMMKDNYFCYELLLPKSKFTVKEVCQRIISDLDGFLEIKSYIEPRKIKCLILTKFNDRDSAWYKNKSKLHQPSGSYEFRENGETFVRYNSISIDFLTRQLNQRTSKDFLYILDESNLAESIDVRLPNKIKDLESLQRSLNDAGLTLKASEIVMPVLVLKKIK